MKEASEILDEMAHNFDLRAVRAMAYPLLKTFKAIFSRIYVNKEGVQEVSAFYLTSPSFSHRHWPSGRMPTVRLSVIYEVENLKYEA